MKILVDALGVIKYQGHDYILSEDRVHAMLPDGGMAYCICDLNSSNSSVHEIDGPIPDWVGGRYLLQDGLVVPNPDWTPPEERP